MFSFLRRELPAAGRVLYQGAIPPPIGQLAAFQARIDAAKQAGGA